MEHAEKELQDTVMEDPSEETVSERHRTQAVAMTETEDLVTDFHKCRLVETLHAEFLEILIGPHVVVALKEVHLHSPVHQTLKGSEYPDVAFRNHIAVFVPEIPYVAKKVQSIGILRKTVEEIRETPFTLLRVRDLQTQMNVRDKICTTGTH